MRLFKWIFFGLLSLLALWLGFAYFAYHFVMTSPAIPLAEADFQPGEPDAPGEKEALLAACRQSNYVSPERREAGCACLSDGAGRELSRYDRSMLKGIITEDFQLLASLTRSLLDRNRPDDSRQVLAAEKARFHALIDACLK